MNAQRAFTLVELVVAMALSVIVIAFTALFIKTPVDIYGAQSRRADLADSADNVLRDISREVRAALPNSVRVNTSGGAVALEMLATVDAVRYRDSDATTAPADELDLSSADAQFRTIGAFESITKPFTSTSHYLVIYNVGVAGADAYELANVITPANTTIQIEAAGTNEDQVTLSPAFRFAYGSPGQRVFLVSGPVTYLCNPTAGTLTRYSGYAIASNQAAVNFNTGSAALIARNVSACDFNYSAGTSERAGLLTMTVTLQRAVAGSSPDVVRLLQQVHVENTP